MGTEPPSQATPTAAPATEAKPNEGPCFPAASSATRVAEIFDADATIGKVFLVGARLVAVHGDELSTLPSTGGSARLAGATNSFLDAVPNGDRIFMLDGSLLTSSSAMLEAPSVISASALAASGLHVDDQFIYFSARIGYSEGYVARHDRTNVYSGPGTNLPERLAEGPVTKWIGGTSDRLFAVAHDDDGAKSSGAVYSMAKPYGGALAEIVSFQNAQPIGFVIDAVGGVIAVTGEHGSANDEIVAFPHDGSSVTELVSAPKGSVSSVAADATRIYYVSSRTSLMRVVRVSPA